MNLCILIRWLKEGSRGQHFDAQRCAIRRIPSGTQNAMRKAHMTEGRRGATVEQGNAECATVVKLSRLQRLGPFGALLFFMTQKSRKLQPQIPHNKHAILNQRESYNFISYSI